MYRNDRLRVWQGKMDLEFAMKDAWEKAQELIRAQGGDPEKILADAARNIEAWREYARKGGILPDEMGADEV